jgi:hypothetical protein
MSANRANIAWHLVNMIGGRDLVPKLGTSGYVPGAVAIKSDGTIGDGVYTNRGTKDSCDFWSEDGLSPILAGGSVQELHDDVSAVQNYELGSRYVDRGPGGNRTFYYGKAINIVRNTMQGLKFYGRVEDGASYTACSTQAADDTTVTITASVTVNQLRGGFIIFHTHGEYADFSRRIISNTVTVGGKTTITLDFPLHIATTTSFGTETCPNPYAFLSYRSAASGGSDGGDLYTSVAGIPTRKAAAANRYLWIQTWGPIWINPQGAVGYTPATNRRDMVFTLEGSIKKLDANAQTTSSQQRAGFLLTRETAGGTGPPLMMLQISP